MLPRAQHRRRPRLGPRHKDLAIPELSLGMDILKHLHLFLAFGEQALYIAPDGAMGDAPPAKP